MIDSAKSFVPPYNVQARARTSRDQFPKMTVSARKSPPDFGNIPVLRRRGSETRFDLHCAARRQSEVSSLEFGGNVGKFPRHFKGLFPIGNVRVRILGGQPRSACNRVGSARSSRKARQWRAFANLRPLSVLPICGLERPLCRKPPAGSLNIPVFERLVPETGFDQH